MVNTNKKVLENLIDLLVYNDIDTFFLVTGGAIVPTVDYLGQQKNVKYYCFQHEQSAAMAAEGYYRTTGKMAAVLTTSGPGAQNLLNGVCGCWYESIPAIFITGQVSTYESLDSINSAPRQVGFQETPIVDAFKPFTKYIVKVQSAETFDFHIKSAIKSAVSGRMGPVLLDLPVDIQNKVIPEFSLERIQKENIVYDLSTDINTLNSKLAQSSKPLLLLGHGIRLSNAVDVVRTLIDKLQIPFVVSWSAFDLIEHSHPLYVGDIGVYGNRGANFVVQNCDLLISIGSRLDTRQTGGDVKTFSPDSYKVMVDIDDNEIYKNRGLTVDLPIVSDAREFIESWLPTIQNDSNNRNEWVSYVNKCKTAEFNKRNLNPDVLSSYEFLEHLNNKIPTNAIIIPDEGGNLVWTMGSISIKGSQRLFSNFGNSSMGYALPSAIGAAIGSDVPVICIDGDGGFQMNIQELQTIKHYNIPLKIFILNNNCYGIIKQFQDAYFDSRYIATTGKDYSAPDFSEVARAYGIPTLVATKENYKDIFDTVLHSSGPVLVNVMIDPEQKLIPKLEFGNALDDMYPYLSDDEFNSYMFKKKERKNNTNKTWVTLK